MWLLGEQGQTSSILMYFMCLDASIYGALSMMKHNYKNSVIRMERTGAIGEKK